MYCRNCGATVNKNAEYCMTCGTKPLNGSEYCYNCSVETATDQEICLKCGVNLNEVKIKKSNTTEDTYCRHCGSEVDKNAEFCMNCGKRPLAGIDFCQNCGSGTSENQEICINCGFLLQNINKIEKKTDYNLNSDDLSEYYRDEFKKIKSSNGIYKGKWNWAAFFFGGLWALYKGMWQIGLIIFVIAYFTSDSYIIPGIIWTFMALRGNYLYYRFKEYDEVFPDFKKLF